MLIFQCAGRCWALLRVDDATRMTFRLKREAYVDFTLELYVFEFREFGGLALHYQELQ